MVPALCGYRRLKWDTETVTLSCQRNCRACQTRMSPSRSRMMPSSSRANDSSYRMRTKVAFKERNAVMDISIGRLLCRRALRLTRRAPNSRTEIVKELFQARNRRAVPDRYPLKRAHLSLSLILSPRSHRLLDKLRKRQRDWI